MRYDESAGRPGRQADRQIDGLLLSSLDALSIRQIVKVNPASQAQALLYVRRI